MWITAGFAALLAVTLGLIGLHVYNASKRDAVKLVAEPPRIEPPPSAGDSRPSRSGHVRPAPNCLANTRVAVRDPDTVYRWKDESGTTHYSDQPPDEIAAVERVGQTDVEPVALAIEGRGARLPPHARSRAIADAVAIGKIFANLLNLKVDRKIALKAIIAGSDAEYRRLVPDPVSLSGVYLGAERLIVVRANVDPDRTMAVLRHEITHAAIHEWVGRLPTSLNEGLAEYFEHFSAQGMGGSVDVATLGRRFAAIPASKLRPARLRELLSAPYDQFHGHDEDDNYLQSAALVATLMSTPGARERMAQLLKAQSRQACVPVDAAAVLSLAWPGGWDALFSAWQQTQRLPAGVPHAY